MATGAPAVRRKPPYPTIRIFHMTISKAVIAAVAVPVFYLVFYTPYGMDTTDFGYFYAYGWRILQGQVPYNDFFYIKPAFPLYWHAFWLWLTPQNWQILAGKAGFCFSLLGSAWLGTLYLARIFDFGKLGISIPVFATCAFVFGIHTFPHMPWHTADGVLFCSGALFAGVSGWPALAGLLAAAATLCKQSFVLVPVAIMLFLLASRRQWLTFLAAFVLGIGLWLAWLLHNDAWTNFREMTTGQLDIREAVEAGILIYLHQNWVLPLIAVLPFAIARVMHANLPPCLAPGYCYLVCLTVWYIYSVFSQQTWIGFGASWPTLFVLLGGIAILLPKVFLLPYAHPPACERPFAASLGLCAALVASWSVAISGGYKIPAFFAAPLMFSFFLWHRRFFGASGRLAWFTLACGLIMFGVGWQYPYVFPARPLERSHLLHDAGAIYPQAQGVKVDADMLERLRELKALRSKYGANYKTLPGFSFAYYLNGDMPVIGSDWLIDWEINGQIDRLYKDLLDKNVTVFMERDQLDTTQADGYARAGYGVPQLVRRNWRIVEETPHFVVFQPPSF